MNKKLQWVGGSLLAAGLIAAGVVYTHFDDAVPYVAMGINYFRYMNAPRGTISIETAPNVAALPAPAKPTALKSETDADWPSYNKTLTSKRFSELDQITEPTSSELKVLCTYRHRAVHRLQRRLA